MKANAPRVSVILPTFNRADVLERAIHSVLTQTFHDLEVCIVDDGSTDETPDIVERITDRRIRSIRLPRNTGASGARNAGIEATKGEFIAFQDSDDVWLPEKLHRQVQRLDDSDKPVAVGCGWRLIDGRPGQIPTQLVARYRDLLKGGLPGSAAHNLVVRRISPQPLWDTSLRCFEDWMFLLDMSKHGLVAFVPEALVEVTRGRNDHLANPANALAGFERILETRRSELGPHPDLVSLYHVRASREAAAMRNLRASINHMKAANRMERPPLSRFVEFGLGLALGRTGHSLFTRLRGRRGY